MLLLWGVVHLLAGVDVVIIAGSTVSLCHIVVIVVADIDCRYK